MIHKVAAGHVTHQLVLLAPQDTGHQQLLGTLRRVHKRKQGSCTGGVAFDNTSEILTAHVAQKVAEHAAI